MMVVCWDNGRNEKKKKKLCKITKIFNCITEEHKTLIKLQLLMFSWLFNFCLCFLNNYAGILTSGMIAVEIAVVAQFGRKKILLFHLIVDFLLVVQNWLRLFQVSFSKAHKQRFSFF